MRVLHILAPGEAGGLERIVQALALGHQQRGVEVHLAVILDAPEPEHPFFEPLAGSAVRVHPLPVPLRAYRRERAAVRDLLRRLRPQVVHTHGYRTDVIDAGVARREGIPIVSTVHGFTGGGRKNRLYERLQRWCYRRFDAVVAVSVPMVDGLARDGVPRGRIHLLPNAWGETSRPIPAPAARAALGVPADAFHLGWVGRLSREKGPDVLVDALPHLSELAPTTSFIGDGRTRPSLAERAAALGVGERIRWHGIIADAGRLFAAFDVFVLSSRTEGTPVVLFEAMAAGVPIVATRVGGVPHVVSQDEAMLVPSDAPAALAAAIRAVHQDPAAARARAERARVRLAREFGAERWLEAYEAIYRRVSGVSASREMV